MPFLFIVKIFLYARKFSFVLENMLKIFMLKKHFDVARGGAQDQVVPEGHNLSCFKRTCVRGSLQSLCDDNVNFCLLKTLYSEFQSCIFHAIVIFTQNKKKIIVVTTADGRSWWPNIISGNCLGDLPPTLQPKSMDTVAIGQELSNTDFSSSFEEL